MFHLHEDPLAPWRESPARKDSETRRPPRRECETRAWIGRPGRPVDRPPDVDRIRFIADEIRGGDVQAAVERAIAGTREAPRRLTPAQTFSEAMGYVENPRPPEQDVTTTRGGKSPAAGRAPADGPIPRRFSGRFPARKPGGEGWDPIARPPCAVQPVGPSVSSDSRLIDRPHGRPVPDGGQLPEAARSRPPRRGSRGGVRPTLDILAPPACPGAARQGVGERPVVAGAMDVRRGGSPRDRSEFDGRNRRLRPGGEGHADGRRCRPRPIRPDAGGVREYRSAGSTFSPYRMPRGADGCIAADDRSRASRRGPIRVAMQVQVAWPGPSPARGLTTRIVSRGPMSCSPRLTGRP